MRFLEKIYLDGFVVAILAVAVFASVLPARGDVADVLRWVTTVVIAVLFFLYGTRLSPAEALAGLVHWRLHTVVLTATFLLFPALGLALRVLVPDVISADLYTGLLYLCLVPSTVQSSIAFVSIARGNVAGAVVSASVSNLLGVFATPLLVIALLNTTGHAAVDASAIADIAAQLLLPFLLGQLLRRWLRRLPQPKIVDRGSILLVVYTAFSAGVVEGIWQRTSVWQVLGVGAVCAGLLAVVLTVTWFGAARFAYADRVVVLFCGSKKSLATGLPMASVLFAGQPVGLIVLPLMIFHQIQLIVCAVLAQRLARAHPDAAAR